MSMATMNPAAGGPVGGGMMMMNNGSPAVPGMHGTDPVRIALNGHIYDYLLKQGHYDIARAVVQDSKFEFAPNTKQSPGRRKDADMNGDGGDGMDMDKQDDAPEDLPRPRGWETSHGNGFLYEWYGIFNDLLSAHRGNNKMNGNMNNPAAQYLMHEKSNQRIRESMQNQGMNRPSMTPQMMQQMRGGMNGKMQQQITPQQMQLMQQKRAVAMQQSMARAEGEGEMNGVRPGTPADGDAGGSPSKRPRIENGQQNFPQGMMPNGRPGGAQGGPNQGMMIQAGFNPAMNPQFNRNGAMPGGPKGMQPGMTNGMMNMGGAGSPMMAGATMGQFPEGMQMDMYNRQNMPGGQPMQGGGAAQSGNHALQDYQMQLMLLEQQNKKRLMMARQEQHENNPGAAMSGVNMQPGMSPAGSRTGTSPNPDAMGGRSPAPMNFMQNIPNENFNGMFMKDQMMAGGGPQGMRPPTSNAEMNAMRQGGNRPAQFQGGQPMQQQGSQAGQQLGTPNQRSDMPPPQAPATAGRNTGNSPSSQPQPPTPSQANKPNPKNKKNAAKDENKRQRPAKKGSAAQQNSDDNPPVTPTPSTPITPSNPGQLNAANKGQPNMQQGMQPAQNQGMNMSQGIPQGDIPFNFADTTGGPGNEGFNLDFSTLESADVLENFDFDSFLNTSAEDNFNFNGDELTFDGMGQNE